MAIEYHIKPGLVVHCDFSLFKPPEMTKARPVLTLNAASGGLITVVGLSSGEPNAMTDVHYKLPRKSLPNIPLFSNKDTWVKGDMVYRVSMARLDLYQLSQRNEDGTRMYYKKLLGREQMKEIYSCVLYGLGLGKLVEHL